MIQRLQTLFLLLAGLSLFSLFLLPFVDTTQATASMNFLKDGVFNIQDHIIFIVMVVLGGGLALLSILLFKNRPLQMRLSYLVLTLCILIPILALALFRQEWNSIPNDTLLEVEYGVLAPLFGFIFSILAIRFIKKDEKLVRSADRLR